MKILHLIRTIDDPRALDTAHQQRHKGHEVALLLLHDAVLSRVTFEGEVLACQDDVLARGVKTRFETVDYNQIVSMIFDFDKVISW